jgi:peptidoglycan/LPS O-acetylase OafA/YrhL
MKFFQLDPMENRVFGLDFVRFLAIFIVLFNHSLILVPQHITPYMRFLMFDGVDIFFVLSGYLIGGILLKILTKDQPSFPLLLHFWKRRWLRTYPAYIILLLLLSIYTLLLRPTHFPDDWYKYPFFLQNLISEKNMFFGESWSLSVEEWFYLTIPTLLFVALFLFKNKLKITSLFVCIAVILGIIYYRSIVFNRFGHINIKDIEAVKHLKTMVESNLKYEVLPRLDSIMFGVLGAWFALFFPKIWTWKYNYLFALLAIIPLYLGFENSRSITDTYTAVWDPAVKSLTVLLILPFFSTLKTVPGKIAKSITFLSLISYSMYLLNLTIVSQIFIKNTLHGNLEGRTLASLTPKELAYNDFTKYWPGKHIIGEFWYVDLALFWILTIGLGFVLYKLVEVPFMKMRK